MEKQIVVSSSVAWVGYAASARMLVVGFVRGTVYEFLDVPVSEHLALMSASSKGRHFNQFIKGCYPHRRLTPGSSCN